MQNRVCGLGGGVRRGDLRRHGNGALGGWNRGVPGVADWDPGPKNHFTGRLVLPLR